MRDSVSRLAKKRHCWTVWRAARQVEQQQSEKDERRKGEEEKKVQLQIRHPALHSVEALCSQSLLPVSWLSLSLVLSVWILISPSFGPHSILHPSCLADASRAPRALAECHGRSVLALRQWRKKKRRWQQSQLARSEQVEAQASR